MHIPVTMLVHISEVYESSNYCHRAFSWGRLHMYAHLKHRCLQPYCIRPDKLDLLFCISHLLNVRPGGRSLFITSKNNIHSEIGTTAIRSGCAIALKVIMTVEVAGLRGSGRNNKSSFPGLKKCEC